VVTDEIPSGLDLKRVITTSFLEFKKKKIGLSVNCIKLWGLLSLLVFRSFNLVLGVNFILVYSIFVVNGFCTRESKLSRRVLW